MAKRISRAVNKVSAKELLSAAEGSYTPYSEIEWRGISLKIKKHLSLDEMVGFVMRVVDNCFEEGTERYRPELKDFILKDTVLESYGGLTLPKNVGERYRIIYHSDILDTVMEFICKEQYLQICDAIDKGIEYRVKTNIEDVASQVNEVINEINELGESLAGIFSGVDNETVSKLANAVAGGTFDEHKLARAFLDEKAAKSDEKIIEIPKTE